MNLNYYFCTFLKKLNLDLIQYFYSSKSVLNGTSVSFTSLVIFFNSLFLSLRTKCMFTFLVVTGFTITTCLTN